ncbi:RHS repeat-associated core domain-containing protein [Streptomyces sp. NPDC048448]|uniref:RHS repeat-associated core domain-containing protein n=1 Tax=Streptomyces sp. NPDC048448 TaxID=3365554 RepID=UPI003718EA2B
MSTPSRRPPVPPATSTTPTEASSSAATPRAKPSSTSAEPRSTSTRPPPPPSTGPSATTPAPAQPSPSAATKPAPPHSPGSPPTNTAPAASPSTPPPRPSPSATPPPSAPRTGGTGSWPDDKAFVGASADTASGLTHLGAREYDPTTGRFISVDPLLTLDQHQSLNGYTYGNNNPTTGSDPTGLMNVPTTDGGGDGGDKVNSDGSPGGGGTASTDSTGDSEGTGKSDCWPIYTCQGPSGEHINNMGNGGPSIPSTWRSYSSNSLLMAMLRGDWDKIFDPTPNCPSGFLCERPPPVGDVAFGPARLESIFVARSSETLAQKMVAARLEALYMKANGIKSSRSALAGTLEVEGRAPKVMLAISGKHWEKGLIPTVGSPGNPARFRAVATGRNPRIHDTEYKMLTYVANQLGDSSASVRGSLTLHSSQQACTSCTGVIGQFHDAFPNVRINYTSGRS